MTNLISYSIAKIKFSRKACALIGGGTLIVLGVTGYIIHHELTRRFLTVGFLDIGQGDSIFIEAPNGNQMLIDGGPAGQVIQELTAMLPFYDRAIDVVLATHADNDHVGGLPDVINRYHVSRIVKTEVAASSSVYHEFVSDVAQQKIPVLSARRGQRLVLDATAGVYFDVLFPDRDPSGWETNLSSIVGMLHYGNVSVLLTGDSPRNIERYLVEIDGEQLHANILKLGHHGSRTSSDEKYLAAVKPDLAIISAGKDNRYGHPHKETLERLDKFHIPFLTTIDHRLVFQSDGRSIWEVPAKESRPVSNQ